MAKLLDEGFWTCTVLSATTGENKNSLNVQINVRIEDGPSAGRLCTYEDSVNAKSATYIQRSCKAVGWTGGKTGYDLKTLAADVDAWVAKTGGKSTVEVRHLDVKNGPNAGTVWAKVSSIGRGGPRVLGTPTAELLADANEAMRRAMADDVGDETPTSTEDIPF